MIETFIVLARWAICVAVIDSLRSLIRHTTQYTGCSRMIVFESEPHPHFDPPHSVHQLFIRIHHIGSLYTPFLLTNFLSCQRFSGEEGRRMDGWPLFVLLFPPARLPPTFELATVS